MRSNRAQILSNSTIENIGGIMPTKPQWTKQLETLRACKEAVVWASQYPSLAEAWAVCERGDWMLWLVARTMGNKLRSTLVLAACECARLALPYVADGG